MRALIAAFAAGLLFSSVPPQARAASRPCPVPPATTYKHGTVTFTEDGQTTRVDVEIADSRITREFGLMCRTALPRDEGMLFVFQTNTQDPFWMEYTLIPLSIAFLDAGWHVVSIKDMTVEPDPAHPKTIYSPGKPYRYAIEVNEGFFAQHGIDAGAQVSFTPQEPAGH